MTFGFRPARPASPGWHLLKTLAQTAVFWSLFLGIIPWLLIRWESLLGWPRFAFPGQFGISIVGFTLASLLGLASGFTMAWFGEGTPLPMDTARELVVRGPYRYVRNPMAIAGLGQAAFIGLGLGSAFTLAYVLTGLVLWNTWVRPVEEAELASRFGDAYQRYRAEVPCWRPVLPGYRIPV